MISRIVVVYEETDMHAHPIARLLTHFFKQYMVTSCSLKEAQDHIGAGCDMVVLDVAAGGALEMVRALRRDYPETMILALTSLGAKNAETKLLSAGANDVIVKPAMSARLESSVRNLLRIRALERELQSLKDA